MYAEDNFFHLSLWGQAGLICLSSILVASTIWAYLKISNRFSRSVKALLALVFFLIFIWLSPQAYYFYYRVIFEGLPSLMVIGLPPSPIAILKTITLNGKHSLAEHGKALLFWALILLSLRDAN